MRVLKTQKDGLMAVFRGIVTVHMIIDTIRNAGDMGAIGMVEEESIIAPMSERIKVGITALLAKGVEKGIKTGLAVGVE